MSTSLTASESFTPPDLFTGWWDGLVAFTAFDAALLAEPDMALRIALQLLLLLASAFFSGSETALFSLSRLDLQQLRRRQHPQTTTLLDILDQPRRLIISVLCGNEIVNIAAVANMTGILVSLYGEERAGLINVAIMVPLLLLFGEITPKTVAVSNPVRVSAGIVAAPMALWIKLITPLRFVLRGVSDQVTGWIVGAEKAAENILQLDEFRTIVDEVANEGELHATERTLIYHLLDAGATEIVEIMTPRTRTAFIDADADLNDAVRRFRALRHSRVPVFRGHRDNLVGFLHLEDVLPLVVDEADLSGARLESILRPLVAVPPTKRVDEMFDFFQANNTRAAVVLDEFGGVAGIVTMRDVLTFIFGHLSGEVKGQELYQERDENLYEVPGDMKLTDFNDLTNFGISDPRMTTIGGVAFRHLDRLPQEGDQVEVEGFEIRVIEMDEQRIARVRVSRGKTVEEPEEAETPKPHADGGTSADARPASEETVTETSEPKDQS
ncbi:MAG: hemolysin family protein [Pseudomonadota bacterium]|nr:hemolysin family protein [Pseudomonadota bacterium]